MVCDGTSSHLPVESEVNHGFLTLRMELLHVIGKLVCDYMIIKFEEA